MRVEEDSFDIVRFLQSYEARDKIPFPILVRGFQYMINCGMVWKMGNQYTNKANQLIKGGHCERI